ncbi:MAG: FtsX-like permease family protein [Bacteroidota bacterium]
MIPILAWRNIWRNPTRSAVVIIAIALGIWAAMFMSGFATGMAQSYINNSIANRISHLQIHNPSYQLDKETAFYIPEIAAIQDVLAAQSYPVNYSFRTLANGMIASSKSSRGIQINGIVPEHEDQVTGLQEKIVDGDYFTPKGKNQLLISTSLAKKLGVKLRSRLVLTFQDVNRDITSAAFRVVGLFDTGNTPFDESLVFVRQGDLEKLIRGSAVSEAPVQLVHEVAVFLDVADNLPLLEAKLNEQFPETEIQNYRALAPDVQLYESMIGSISMIYLVIIMLALIFGIINTMLMAVLERTRELGMLMAIGMNKVKVFSMILFETLLLCLVGMPLGILLGGITTAYIGRYGLNLSAFSSTLKMYGMSDIIYFNLDPTIYWQVAFSVSLTALFAAIYPALKAIRLRPVEAIRKI